MAGGVAVEDADDRLVHRVRRDRIVGGEDGEADEVGEIAQPVRAALTGTNVSPPIFEVMQILGRDETMGRIGDALR